LYLHPFRSGDPFCRFPLRGEEIKGAYLEGRGKQDYPFLPIGTQTPFPIRGKDRTILILDRDPISRICPKAEIPGNRISLWIHREIQSEDPAIPFCLLQRHRLLIPGAKGSNPNLNDLPCGRILILILIYKADPQGVSGKEPPFLFPLRVQKS
jgi:hypothetical protein